MKKLLLLFTTLSLFVITSCSLEDDKRVEFHMEFVPIVGVEMPEYFERGQIYPIKVMYTRPNDCHYFEGFSYEPDGNVRIIAAQTIVIEDSDCLPLESEQAETASFNFECSPLYANQSYVFKFYQGEDTLGNQQFLEIEVPVMQ